jgi:hypothetical protein
MTHLVEKSVKPAKIEPAVGRFEGVPGQVSYPDDVETRRLHNRDIGLDLIFGSVNRLIASPDEQLAGTGEASRRTTDIRRIDFASVQLRFH